MPAIELISTSLASDPNLQGYWRLESNGADSGPNGYTLTGTNPSFVASVFGNGGDFESTSSQYLAVASATNLETIGDQTFVCWFKPESVNIAQRIMAKVDAAASQGRAFGITTSGTVDFRSFKTGDDQSVTTTTTLSAGVQYHLAVVYTSSGQGVKIFINGNLDKSGSFSRAMVTTTGNFSISRLGSLSAEYCDGIVDDAAFFNRALSNLEISQLYNGTLPALSANKSRFYFM